MNTKILMTASALFLAITGIGLSFLPREIATYLEVEPSVITILFLKILSALYMGFAILNWMARGSLFGGIYNRPIVLGNLMHFAVGALALIKIFSKTDQYPALMICLTGIYVLFALLFIFTIRNNPVKPA